MTKLVLVFFRPPVGGVEVATLFLRGGQKPAAAFMGRAKPPDREALPSVTGLNPGDWPKKAEDWGRLPSRPGARSLLILCLTWASRGLSRPDDETDGVTAIERLKESAEGRAAERFLELLRREINYPDDLFGYRGLALLRNLIRTRRRGNRGYLVLNTDILRPRDILVYEGSKRLDQSDDVNELILTVDEQIGREPPPTPPPPEPSPCSGGALPLDDGSYVERQADREVAEAVAAPERTVLIQGPRQSGKTSLLARMIHRVYEEGEMLIVHLDLQDFDKDVELSSLWAFCRAVAVRMVAQLGLSVDVDDPPWGPHQSAKTRLTRFLAEHARGAGATRLLIVIDEADHLFHYGFRDEVFREFRVWHNHPEYLSRGGETALTLVLAYANEPSSFIKSVDESPFNVGYRTYLNGFDEGAVDELNRRLGSPLRSKKEVREFREFLGGLPYLINCGLYQMAKLNLDLSGCRARAEALFEGHLRDLLVRIDTNPAFTDAVLAVLDGRQVPPETFYQLRALGILAGESSHSVRFACPLYEIFLRRHFG